MKGKNEAVQLLITKDEEQEKQAERRTNHHLEPVKRAQIVLKNLQQQGQFYFPSAQSLHVRGSGREPEREKPLARGVEPVPFIDSIWSLA